MTLPPRRSSGDAPAAVVDDTAVEHPDDSVGPPADCDVVGDDQERQAALDVQPSHQRGDLLGRLAVEVAGRLVGPHDRGVVDERAGDRDALALAAGQLVRDVAGAVGEPDEPEGIQRALARLARRRPARSSSGNSTFSTADSTGIRL